MRLRKILLRKTNYLAQFPVLDLSLTKWYCSCVQFMTKRNSLNWQCIFNVTCCFQCIPLIVFSFDRSMYANINPRSKFVVCNTREITHFSGSCVISLFYLYLIIRPCWQTLHNFKAVADITGYLVIKVGGSIIVTDRFKGCLHWFYCRLFVLSEIHILND